MLECSFKQNATKAWEIKCQPVTLWVAQISYLFRTWSFCYFLILSRLKGTLLLRPYWEDSRLEIDSIVSNSDEYRLLMLTMSEKLTMFSLLRFLPERRAFIASLNFVFKASSKLPEDVLLLFRVKDFGMFHLEVRGVWTMSRRFDFVVENCVCNSNLSFGFIFPRDVIDS